MKLLGKKTAGAVRTPPETHRRAREPMPSCGAHAFLVDSRREEPEADLKGEGGGGQWEAPQAGGQGRKEECTWLTSSLTQNRPCPQMVSSINRRSTSHNQNAHY